MIRPSPQWNLAFCHAAVACPDVDDCVAWIASATGATAVPGGVFESEDARNALFGAGEKQYLGIIGPHGLPRAGTEGAELSELDAAKVYLFAWQTDDLQAVERVLHAHPVRTSIEQRQRRSADGTPITLRRLRIVAVEGRPPTQHWPVFLDWMDSPHPSFDAPPEQLSYVETTILDPYPELLATVLGDLDLGVSFEKGPTPELRIEVTGPEGTLRISG